MYSKKPETDEDELVLMETQELNEKCGKCDGQLVIKIYWGKDDYHKKIECTECGMKVWIKRKD